ncbi:MAG: 4Fe-4S dicluster domain-containing protein [Candidatus Polarisedimenticolaceae bacterium]|nr:4Fe-4S dicluster domain-containing protein [Candidatus Polarisedimenticolaceae bacterium]
MLIEPQGQSLTAIQELERSTGEKITDCYQCGKCTAGCPASMDPPPSVLIRKLQLGMFDEVVSEQSIWSCMACLTCSERCPKGVSPAAIIEGLKLIHLRDMDPQVQAEELGQEFLAQSTQQAVVSGFRKFI